MAPIRVALVGLSSGAKTSWAATGHLPYLISARGKQNYELVALLNSSEKAAETAKLHFDLPSSVKAYGDPEALAKDPDIDLVVCNTRVDLHFATTEPSLRAGKAVYIEWPLAHNIELASQLLEHPRSAVSISGLQTRVAPVIMKMNEVLSSGRIGRVLSSDVKSFSSVLPRDALPEGLTYFADRKVGGNLIAIGFTHMIDYIHEVLGEFETCVSRMQIQRPTLGVLGADGTRKGTIPSDVPDLLIIHGKLASGKADIVENATLNVTWRSSPPFPGTPGLVWTVYGEKGELRMTSPSGPYIELDLPGPPITLEVIDYATNEVAEVEWKWEDWQKEIPMSARMVAVVYERYARQLGKGADMTGENKYATLSEAVVRMREIEGYFVSFDASRVPS